MSSIELGGDRLAFIPQNELPETARITETESADTLAPNILVVDNDPLIRDQLSHLYAQNGFAVDAVSSAEDALVQLRLGKTDFVITDIKLAGTSGAELIASISESHPDVPVIAMTAALDAQRAIRLLKLGSVDVVVKPFEAATVLGVTQAALDKVRVCTEIRHLRRALNTTQFGNMLSNTPEMHRLFETIKTVAGTDMAVVIEGETGTDKELVATAIHYHSKRRKRPFVTIKCTGLPDHVLEQELFGFDGGYRESVRAGKIELAHGGTLFLDEVEGLSIAMQVKLLAMIEDRTVLCMGDLVGLPTDLRVITSTTTPLKQLVAEGKMRSDFYYRTNVAPILLMPLRERRGDIPMLVNDFLHRHPVAAQRGILSVSKQVMRLLVDYSWPGNMRELQNILERAIILTSGGVIERIDLPQTADGRRPEGAVPATLSQWLREKEKQFLEQKLENFGGSIRLTARSCGIGLRSLYRKMQKHGLDKKDFRHSGAS